VFFFFFPFFFGGGVWSWILFIMIIALYFAVLLTTGSISEVHSCLFTCYFIMSVFNDGR